MVDPKDMNATKVSFKDTLNLPRTEFSIRPKADSDRVILQRWQDDNLDQKAYACNAGSESFIIHDGPPYANGHLHLGHAYNNILKDIISKYHRMSGKHVPIIPGWDCHGLPIELAVVKEKKYDSKEALKKACRTYAQKWIDIQGQELQRMGILMDWKHPYTTMSPLYESYILQAFKRFLEQGYIERKNKTVAWCPTCRTVLSSAEIEYNNKKDPSIYVLFPLVQSLKTLVPEVASEKVNVLIWTTTPWTLPLNRAVMIKAHTPYVVIRVKGEYVMVAQALLNKLTPVLGEYTVIAEVNSDALLAHRFTVRHPFIEDLLVPLIADASVSLEEGTAFVHCAPGCGPQDYEAAIHNNLEIFSPITAHGKYDVGIVPEQLQGMSYIEGQQWVISELQKRNRLLYQLEIDHAFPHCWRCHKPLIFRATKQWFCDLSKHDLRSRAISAIDTITMLPAASANRLKAAVEGRLEWCLSRQRVWGTPIPALLCTHCDYTYSTPELIERVSQKVAHEGIEAWDTITIADLVPADFVCPECGNKDFSKEQDILDVWFESGLVQYILPLLHQEEHLFPADLYIEGKDQHRGWFQSSLLNSMVLHGVAPTKAIVTHGFTVDEKGYKMSKSLGNVISPEQMISKLGIDGLRLWVSSIDYADDAVVSQSLIDNVSQVAHKIRNTCRFLLSNLYDFDHTKDGLHWNELQLIDQIALQELALLQKNILQAYARYDFTAVFHILGEYCAVHLSAFYLDISKDRLYVEKADGVARRSAQTACFMILDALTRLIAPIMSFVAEELSDFYQGTGKKESIHLQRFATLAYIPALNEAGEASFVAQVTELKKVRSAVLKSIEGLRAKGEVKHSLEAAITLCFDSEPEHLIKELLEKVLASGQAKEQFLKELLIVSDCKIVQTTQGLQQSEYPGLFVGVAQAHGTKCPRCWQWEQTNDVDGLCKRCQRVVR